METLNQLNEKGRQKLAELREELSKLELYCQNLNDPKHVTELISQRQQLARYTYNIYQLLLNLYHVFRLIQTYGPDLFLHDFTGKITDSDLQKTLCIMHMHDTVLKRVVYYYIL